MHRASGPPAEKTGDGKSEGVREAAQLTGGFDVVVAAARPAHPFTRSLVVLPARNLTVRSRQGGCGECVQVRRDTIGYYG